MSDISLTNYDQTLVVEAADQEPVVIRSYTQELVINPVDQSTTVIYAGPQGPAGPQGLPGAGADPQAIDDRIAIHNQAEVAHGALSSGRDFSALFTLGIT